MTKRNTYINKWINTIQCMDCVAGMNKFPDNSVDLIIADPPYAISRKLNTENKRLGTTAKLNFNFGKWDKFNYEWFEIAKQKNKSFRYCIEKYNCKTDENVVNNT